jgi:pimeloyl-ACP methyl ester carboxylesterase
MAPTDCEPEQRVQVKRRRVIYVPGYDPRGLPEYFRMFRTELQKFRSLYNVDSTLSKLDRSDRQPIWTIHTAADGWKVETHYHFLRWEDIIQGDFARPAWWKILHLFRVMAIWLVDGTLLRITRASWRCTCFILYAPIAFLLSGAVSAFVGCATSRLTAAFLPNTLLVAAIGVVVAVLTFIAVVRAIESQLMCLYLADSFVSAHDFAHRQRPDWETRLQEFAVYLAETVARNDADEIVVVGHSFGSFLAIDVLARALEHDPQLGRHGPRVALLTVGPNHPLLGLNRAAGWFHDRLQRLVAEPSIDWVEYQTRKDVMNFYWFDPVVRYQLDRANFHINLRVVPISFRDIISEDWNRMRWRFFRIHFQTIMANERPSHYDYFLIVCGPFELRYRAEHYFEMRDAAFALARSPHWAVEERARRAARAEAEQSAPPSRRWLRRRIRAGDNPATRV